MRAVGFDDVVFDEWVRRPAVDGQISVAVWFKCSTIVYSSGIRKLWSSNSHSLWDTYFDPPGLHPLPTTKFPLLPVQVTL